MNRNLQTGCFMVIFQTAMVSGNVTPSPHTSTTASSSGASRQERRRWSLLRNHWSWLWPPGRQDRAQCCSAPKTPALSSSYRWWWRDVCVPAVAYIELLFIWSYFNKLYLYLILPGSGRVFGRHGKSISCNKQPPANHQVLLLTYFSPVWGQYSNWTQLLHTSLLPPHAQPLHHPSTCFWGTRWSALFY